jgi:hypothetical protein
MSLAAVIILCLRFGTGRKMGLAQGYTIDHELFNKIIGISSLYFALDMVPSNNGCFDFRVYSAVLIPIFDSGQYFLMLVMM